MSRRRKYADDGCCRNRTSLELALLGIVSVGIIFSVTLSVFLAVHIPDASTNICKTSECLLQATKLSQRIDLSADPCTDFYQFACGDFLKNAHGNEKLGAFLSVQEETERQFLELYSEPVTENEHEAVKIAKNLFRACMDEDTIAANGLKEFKIFLTEIGGWPIVEGFDWDHTKFDWLQAMYRLRRAGYPYSIFLDLLVIPDPENTDTNIFEISIPSLESYDESAESKRKKIMVNVALVFGAEKGRAVLEIQEVLEFERKLYQQGFVLTHIPALQRKFTLSEFNQTYMYNIDWLQFINTIAGPGAQILRESSVIFPKLDFLEKQLYLLSKTPKRVQSNYLVWKVVEKMNTYLAKNFQGNEIEEKGEAMNRKTFCLKEVQERFLPSPLTVMYTRKYLTVTKKIKAEQLVNNIKTEFIQILQKMKWINETDKKVTLELAETVNVVVGTPDEDYVNERILDELIVDMPLGEFPLTNTFLNLFTRVNRNFKSMLYSKIHKSNREIALKQWFSGSISDYILYDANDNILRVPATMLQGIFFDENRPQYMNYGSLGTAVGHEMTNTIKAITAKSNKIGYALNGWSSFTIRGYKIKLQCLAKDLINFNPENNKFLPETVFRETVGLMTSYTAYKKLENGSENKNHAISSRFTKDQLFWISAASTACQPRNFVEQIFRETEDYSSALIYGPLRNNPKFSEDFSCALESPMNPYFKCDIY